MDEKCPGRCSEYCAVPTTEEKRASWRAWVALEWKPRVPFPAQEEGVGVLGRLSPGSSRFNNVLMFGLENAGDLQEAGA